MVTERFPAEGKKKGGGDSAFRLRSLPPPTSPASVITAGLCRNMYPTPPGSARCATRTHPLGTRHPAKGQEAIRIGAAQTLITLNTSFVSKFPHYPHFLLQIPSEATKGANRDSRLVIRNLASRKFRKATSSTRAAIKVCGT